MVTAGDFRNGVTFEEDGNVMQIVEFQHVKPGKGAAFVRAKVKNVISGSVVEKTYNPTAKFPTAFVERKEIWSIHIQTATFTTLWTLKLMNRFLLVKTNFLKTLSLLRKIWYVRFVHTRARYLLLNHRTLLTLK